MKYRKTENIHEEEKKEDDEDEKKMDIEEEDDDDAEFDELLAWLKKHKSSLSGVAITPADFEKDQDANFHIQALHKLWMSLKLNRVFHDFDEIRLGTSFFCNTSQKFEFLEIKIFGVS